MFGKAIGSSDRNQPFLEQPGHVGPPVSWVCPTLTCEPATIHWMSAEEQAVFPPHSKSTVGGGALRLSGISGQRSPGTAPSFISEQNPIHPAPYTRRSGQLIATMSWVFLCPQGQAAFSFHSSLVCSHLLVWPFFGHLHSSKTLRSLWRGIAVCKDPTGEHHSARCG